MPCASGSKLTPGRAVVSRWYGRTGAIHSTVGALAAKSRACGLPARVMTCRSCGGAARPGPPPAILGPSSCRSTKPSTSSLPKASSGSGLDAYTRYKTCKAKLRPCREFPSGLEHAFEAHAGHEHRGEQGHGSRGAEARLVVDAQAPEALQAAEGLLGLPAAGLGLEALAAWRADNLGGDAVTLKESARIVAGEAAVEPDKEEGGVEGEIRGDALQRRVAILCVGRHHPHAERIALRVDHQHPLAALDRLVGVVAPRPALRSGLRAPRGDDRGRRPALPASREAAAGRQNRPCSVEHRPQPPARETAPHAPMWRQACWQPSRARCPSAWSMMRV